MPSARKIPRISYPVRDASCGGIRSIVGVLSLCILGGATHAAPKLLGQDADLSALTVSGISSGGYMAVQFHLAHSAWVKGVGVLAAGPYYCAAGNFWTAYYNCIPCAFTPLPPISKLVAATESLARAGSIDSTKNLAASKVWLFSGTRDKTVLPEVVSALASYYKHYVNADHVKLVQDRPAGHAMVSADPDITQACELTASPFINRCIDPETKTSLRRCGRAAHVSDRCISTCLRSGDRLDRGVRPARVCQRQAAFHFVGQRRFCVRASGL